MKSVLHYITIISVKILLFSFLFVFFLFSVFAHESEEYADKTDVIAMTEGLEKCFSLSPDRDACYASLCEDGVGYLCAEDIIDIATEIKGPEFGIMVLREILEGSVFGINTNGHDLAHVVGSSTSRNWGASGDVFNRCPIDFDYGCLHGFFEIAMTKVDSPAEALISVCENMPAEPMFDRVNCYHGGGHGMMMNESYNLDRALEVCDSLPDYFMRQNCWGGVFMENTNGFLGGRIEEEFNTFRPDNPLAPCDSLADKYRHECYILHADYLINNYSTSLDDLIAVCLGAGLHTEVCLRGVARIFSGDRQDMILQGSRLDIGGDFVERAYYLCGQFPEEYVSMCHFFVVGHFIFPHMLYSGFKDSVRYCMLTDFKKRCFVRISDRLDALVDKDEKMRMCALVSERYRDNCTGFENGSPSLGLGDTVRVESGEAVLFSPFHKAILFFSAVLKKIFLSMFASDTFAEESYIAAVQVFDSELKERSSTSFFGKIGVFIHTFFDFVSGEFFGNKKVVLKKVLTPEEDSERLLYDDVFTDGAIQTYTLRSLTQSLSRLGYAKGIDCHNRAHEMGRRAYELLAAEAFKQCGIECHSGCRHGATEAFFADKGTADLTGSVRVLCGEEQDRFGMHQCVHGVGHGLMAWYDYGLYDALGACDLIGHSSNQESCYSGVFMENIVGGIVRDEAEVDPSGYHYTDFLSDDPHYPCNAVEDKYKYQCYWLQTDRILQLNGPDSIGVTCAEAPELFQSACFRSMGRTISAHFSRNPAKNFSMCTTVPDVVDRDVCLSGALSDLFWDYTQADGALELCAFSSGSSFEQECYNQLIVRGSEVVPKSFMRDFCVKLPDRYYAQCMHQEAPSAFSLSGGDDFVSSVVEKTDNAVIRYINGQYVPNRVHISVGQQVVWVNEDEVFWPASNLHPTHTAYPNSDVTKCTTLERTEMFDACEALGFNTKYSFVFDRVGEWRYHDHINPQATGMVIVSE